MRIPLHSIPFMILVLLLSARPAPAQIIDANRLCIHNGCDLKIVAGHSYGYPNYGGGKYFPSFTHWASTPASDTNLIYPWKICGFAWHGMKHPPFSYEKYNWQIILQKSRDNPYASSMSWDYPLLYYQGTVPATGAPQPIYIAQVPTSVPEAGGDFYICPSSMGGFDSYMNIFAATYASWTIPSGVP